MLSNSSGDRIFFKGWLRSPLSLSLSFAHMSHSGCISENPEYSGLFSTRLECARGGPGNGRGGPEVISCRVHLGLSKLDRRLMAPEHTSFRGNSRRGGRPVPRPLPSTFFFERCLRIRIRRGRGPGADRRMHWPFLELCSLPHDWRRSCDCYCRRDCPCSLGSCSS
jgi:hypothetical protein